MHEIAAFRAMSDEMEKIGLGARAGNIIGGLVGAGVGAGTGYMASPEENKIRNAIYGGLIGAGVGVAGGQAATQAGRTEARQFGQRQLHGFTGYLPGRGLIGRGPEGTKWYQLGEKAPPMSKDLYRSKFKEMDWAIPEGTHGELLQKAREDLGSGTFTGSLPEGVREFWAKRRASAQHHTQRIMEAGGTSLPGLAKALSGQSGLSPYEAAKSNLLSQGIIGGIALPAAMAAPDIYEAAKERDPGRASSMIGGTIGYSLAGMTPMAPMTALGMLGSSLAERLVPARQQG